MLRLSETGVVTPGAFGFIRRPRIVEALSSPEPLFRKLLARSRGFFDGVRLPIEKELALSSDPTGLNCDRDGESVNGSTVR